MTHSKLFSVISLLLALCMLMAAFISCGKTEDPTETDAKATESASETEEESETRIPVSLPDEKYGRDFNVLHWTVTESWIPWEEVTTEEMNGDIMNDSVFQRDKTVEEQFDATINVTYEYVADITTDLRKMVSSGDATYDLLIQRSISIVDALTENIFYDADDMQYTDFTKPWWNQDCIESLRLGDMHQILASDMLILDKGATDCLVYNATVAEENEEAVGDLYDLVNKGRWTFEEFIDICDDVAQDLDNDGKRNSNGDLVACVNGVEPTQYLYAGAGIKYGSTDNSGYVEFHFDADDAEVLQTLFDEFFYTDLYYQPEDSVNSVFKSNMALFTFQLVKGLNDYRDMDSNYGVLPVPKYDDSQTEYTSLVFPHHDSVMAVPLSASDLQFTGVMLEALSSEGYYTTYPTFYDVIITGRSVRDQESKDMLGIIFGNRVYDCGLVWDPGQFTTEVMFYSLNKRVSFTTTYASFENKIQASLDKINGYADQMNK